MSLIAFKNSATPPRQLYWLRHSDGAKAVINPRAVSNTIEGTPPNPGAGFEYLPIFKESTSPDYDPRFTIRTEIEAPNEDETQVNITYTVSDKEKEEVKAAIDDARRFEIQKHLPLSNISETLLLVVGILDRQAKQLQLTEKEQARLAGVVSVASKLDRNIAASDNLKDLVDQGQKPDIDAAWVPVEP